MILIAIFITTVKCIVSETELEDLTISNIESCQISPAEPINIEYIDLKNNNCIKAKLRINQPFGIYTPLNGFVKWETLHRARICDYNYIHQAACNITTIVPRAEETFKFFIFKNCTWKFEIQHRENRHHPTIFTQRIRDKENC